MIPFKCVFANMSEKVKERAAATVILTMGKTPFNQRNLLSSSGSFSVYSSIRLSILVYPLPSDFALRIVAGFSLSVTFCLLRSSARLRRISRNSAICSSVSSGQSSSNSTGRFAASSIILICSGAGLSPGLRVDFIIVIVIQPRFLHSSNSCRYNSNSIVPVCVNHS